MFIQFCVLHFSTSCHSKSLKLLCGKIGLFRKEIQQQHNIIKNLAVERHALLREMMKIMGLSTRIYWLSWFTTAFTTLFITFTIITIFLCVTVFSVPAFFSKSSFILIWIFFLIYITSLITLCFLLSTIFKKPSTAANIGTMIFFAMVIPYNQFSQNFESFHYAVKFLYCLPINTAMGEGVAIVFRFERDADGLQFSNFLDRADVGFSFAEILLAMIVSTIIFVILTIYIENIFTGSFGIAKPWHYPFTACFKRRRNIEANEAVAYQEDNRVTNDDYEPEPRNLKTGIKIKNLTKTFSGVNVVNSLNLNLYDDQITVILGHNGSGKSTTMNIITGVLAPTLGTAFVNEFDVRKETDEARRSLGLCPQQNVLFNDLTLKEHIIFFSKLKGMKNKAEIDAEVSKYVNLLGLEDKLNCRSKTLSGGTKRKLCTINALCGGSKIVILDEASSGVDTGARRALWDLLIQEKIGRTIMLTTQHMDEAETLGDRVAILHEGHLETVGSPYFLKKKFGSGYRLTCVKSTGCDSREVTRVVKESLPDAELFSDAQTEMIFALPEKDLMNFQHLFKILEDEADILRVSSFGCSITTLEEVFLKIGAEDDARKRKNHQTIDVNFDQMEMVNGWKLIFYQIWAMILKKFYFYKRNFFMFVWLILLSAWLIFVFLVVPIESFNEDDSEAENDSPVPDVNITNLIIILVMFFFLLCYWPTLFIRMKIKERVSQSKLLQFIGGANRLIFWLTSFLLDFILFTLIMAIIVAIVFANQRENFKTGTEVGTLILIFTLYGFSVLPLIYLMSFLFEKSSTALILYPIYAALYFLVDIEAVNILANIIFWIGLFYPPFSLVNCFQKYFINAFNAEDNIINFGSNGIGWNLVIMFITGLIFLSFCLMIDYKLFDEISYKLRKQMHTNPLATNQVIDNDVKQEVEKVKSFSSSEILERNLVLRGLSKAFGNLVAVNKLYLDVEPTECFGLIGVNGAGKTTTFKMMIGDERISSGDGWMKGVSFYKQTDKVQKSYCPQFDALLLDLSGKENMEIFCLIRGIPRKEIKEVIESLSSQFDFYQHLHKKTKVFSGGNKRKLSTAISLIGAPSIIFLDEPSSAMDPKAKRKLWDMINRTRNSGKSIVLTSHGMEETEALCTRLAIMVDGEFKCLGSVQHLKNKFAKGFILTVKMEREDDIGLLNQIKTEVHQKFPSAILKERYLKILTFHIADTNLRWSTAFNTMTQMQNEIEISDFIISQMSLEQVFLFFSQKSQSSIEIN
ncbi:CLUMA_CG007849, isoform A [Clunio marinus]|uniref:CLUMA_CG007849, isoform A n=1 Tax=Clunio marinus TaxID=568069 RepID=A0A1J1I5W7_9DIPT|nr:CLUMA_CG007849, isoform A [Clunio marinus]